MISNMNHFFYCQLILWVEHHQPCFKTLENYGHSKYINFVLITEPRLLSQ